MIDKKLTLAFDVDGTLLDKKGKLDPNVLPIFEKTTPSKTNFIFLTGGNVSLAESAINQIKSAVPTFNSTGFWIVANGGSQVRGPSGISQIETIVPTKVTNFISLARAYDKESFLIFTTEKGNFIMVPKSQFSKTAFWFYNKKDKAKGDAALNLQEIEYLSMGRDMKVVVSEIGEIQQVFIKSLKKDNKRKVFSILRQKVGQEYSVYNGSQIAIPARNKASALQYILDTAKSLPSNTMPEFVEDVVYFGDDANDVECLKKCKISVARGEQASNDAKEAAKFCINNLEDFATHLYNGDYNDLFETPKTKKETKSSKAETEETLVL